MKAAHILTLTSAAIAASMIHAQTPVDPLIEPVVPQPSQTTEAAPQPEQPVPANSTPAPAGLPNTPENPVQPVNPSAPLNPTTPAAPAQSGLQAAQQKLEQASLDGGITIERTALNDVLSFLAKKAGRQYFHNSKIAGPDFEVTGILNEGNPLQQMEELAFMYGLSLHTKGNTIYALTTTQLAQLPSTEFHYQLRYLRPTDIEQIKELIKPVLTPATGIVNYEPKTNTVIIIDSAHRIEQARNLLHGIDKTKGQIVVETKIIRVNSTAGERMGVDWQGSLGRDGTSINLARDLNSVFGLPNNLGTVSPASGTNLVLSPVQLIGVLRALDDGGLSSQISNPTLITEDNEQANIAIIDRIPIITQTSTASSGGVATITEEVRYKIDTSDKGIDTDPDKHREIGISLVVTPTLLPDGTIRMKLRPRSAQIVEQITSVLTGNTYPRVTESMVESLARVPDGHSLVVGGFYGEVKSNDKNKVPVLGDIPIVNFFFKSKEASKENTSLVFIVTPKSYNPASRGAVRGANAGVRRSVSLDCEHDWVDEDNPGPAHEPNVKRTVRGMAPKQAPYYPKEEELKREPQFSKGRK
jgi:type II secretory pathway component GspD/PulD (secretin)